jgi:hypothetical protein
MKKEKKKKNTFKMWLDGPDIVLPDGYHWNMESGEVIANDGSWRGGLVDFYNKQKDELNEQVILQRSN